MTKKKKNQHFDVHVYQKGVVWQFSGFLDIQVKICFSFSSWILNFVLLFLLFSFSFFVDDVIMLR